MPIINSVISAGSQPSSKFGVTIDSVFGDIDANGVLQAPTGSHNLTFTGVRTINQGAIKPALLYDLGTVNVSFPDLETIGNRGLEGVAFEYNVESSGLRPTPLRNTALTSVDISNVSYIGNYGLYEAFAYCDNLSSINLPSGTVSYIGPNGLGYLIMHGENCPITTVDMSGMTITQVGQKAFYYTTGYLNNLTTLKYPRIESLEETAGVGSTYTVYTGLSEGCSNLQTIDVSRIGVLPSYGTGDNEHWLGFAYSSFDAPTVIGDVILPHGGDLDGRSIGNEFFNNSCQGRATRIPIKLPNGAERLRITNSGATTTKYIQFGQYITQNAVNIPATEINKFLDMFDTLGNGVRPYYWFVGWINASEQADYGKAMICLPFSQITSQQTGTSYNVLDAMFSKYTPATKASRISYVYMPFLTNASAHTFVCSSQNSASCQTNQDSTFGGCDRVIFRMRPEMSNASLYGRDYGFGATNATILFDAVGYITVNNTVYRRSFHNNGTFANDIVAFAWKRENNDTSMPEILYTDGQYTAIYTTNTSEYLKEPQIGDTVYTDLEKTAFQYTITAIA